MSVLYTTIYSQIQRVTLENAGDGGATWPSGMWTVNEVVNALHAREDRFLAATDLIWTRLETAITTGQADQAAPADWIATIFIALKSSAGLYRELSKMDTLELDYIRSTWPGTSSATPLGYYESDGATLTTYVAPIPTDPGSALERYYVAKGDPNGTTSVVPDEFTPMLKYGILADLLNKVGQASNPTLAAACEERWQEGLAMGQLMATEGWLAL